MNNDIQIIDDIEVKMIPLTSGLLESYGVINTGKDVVEDLVIKFKNGSYYLYKDVGDFVLAKLPHAESVGSYFSTVIKNQYEFVKLELPQPILKWEALIEYGPCGSDYHRIEVDAMTYNGAYKKAQEWSSLNSIPHPMITVTEDSPMINEIEWTPEEEEEFMLLVERLDKSTPTD